VAVGRTSPGQWRGVTIQAGDIYAYTFDLAPFRIAVNPGSINYLGISAHLVTTGKEAIMHRSIDAGVVIGSSADFHWDDQFRDPAEPLNVLFPDAIQNSVRLTMTPN
jgi:hypothetical protein